MYPNHRHVNSTATSRTTSPTISPPLGLARHSSPAPHKSHRDQPSPEALLRRRLYLCRRHLCHLNGAMLPSTIPLLPLHLGPPSRGDTMLAPTVKPTLNLQPGVLGDRPPTLLPNPTLTTKKTVLTSSTMCRPLPPSRGEQLSMRWHTCVTHATLTTPSPLALFSLV